MNDAETNSITTSIHQEDYTTTSDHEIYDVDEQHNSDFEMEDIDLSNRVEISSNSRVIKLFLDIRKYINQKIKEQLNK